MQASACYDNPPGQPHGVVQATSDDDSSGGASVNVLAGHDNSPSKQIEGSGSGIIQHGDASERPEPGLDTSNARENSSAEALANLDDSAPMEAQQHNAMAEGQGNSTATPMDA